MLINPYQLISIELSNIKKLPECTAIYFVIDSQNRILYIGKANNLSARWKNHHRKHQLEEIHKENLVRIAWQAWNKQDLAEAENYLIANFNPLLNGTEVKSPSIIPSEYKLKEFLKTFSRRLIIIGVKQKKSNELPNIYLKYDWKDCSPKGTAAKIKNFIYVNKDNNTNFKIKRKKYGRIIPTEVFRPGSRAQKVNARENRSYNNHWYMTCNGAIIHITPTNNYKGLKVSTVFKRLAGIKMRAIDTVYFSQIQNQYLNEFSELSCYKIDLIPLFWSE